MIFFLIYSFYKVYNRFVFIWFFFFSVCVILEICILYDFKLVFKEGIGEVRVIKMFLFKCYSFSMRFLNEKIIIVDLKVIF